MFKIVTQKPIEPEIVLKEKTYLCDVCNCPTKHFIGGRYDGVAGFADTRIDVHHRIGAPVGPGQLIQSEGPKLCSPGHAEHVNTYVHYTSRLSVLTSVLLKAASKTCIPRGV